MELPELTKVQVVNNGWHTLNGYHVAVDVACEHVVSVKAIWQLAFFTRFLEWNEKGRTRKGFNNLSHRTKVWIKKNER